MRFTVLLLTFTGHFFTLAQTTEQDMLRENLDFFKQVITNVDALKNTDEKLYYLDSVHSRSNSDYIIQRLNLLKAKTFRSTDLNSAFKLLNNVETYIKKHPDYLHLNTHFKIVKGRALYDSGKHEESLNHYKEAEMLLKQLKNPDTFWNYALEIKTGIISNYVSLDRNDEAIQQLTELEKSVSRDDKLDDYIYVLNMLGFLHTKSKNYKDGIRYFTKLTDLAKDKAQYKEAYFGAVNNLGYIFKNTGDSNEAVILLEEAIIQAKNYQILNKELLLSNNLGYLYLDAENLNKAEILGLSTLEKSKNTFEDIEAESQRLLAVVYYKKEELVKALNYTELASQFFRKTNDLKRLKYVLGIKNKILIKQENFKEATKVNSQMISLMDSISLKNDMQNLQKTLVAFETEKKDKEITILKQKEELASVKLAQQRDKIIFLVGLLVILLALGIIVFTYHKKLGRIQNLALRSKLTRSQFNPHYINNAFTALQAELTEHNFNENLINYTSNISRFSRLVLESTFNDEWTLKEEKNMIDNYLSIQQHRLEHSFQYHIVCNIKNELWLSKIPSALTQTVLENAIEHGGFSTTNNTGKIEVLISQIKDQLHISIKNNILSNGPIPSNEVKERPSRGLEITRQRIALHKKIYGRHATLNLTKEENEVEVLFELPLLVA
ncbi:histidine kinase [Winogradskyella maritima]|uniref:Histidine kinase n=1 Tax=Winogradskyella maritima TaxID=1517766 RepID=A0ABV8AI02_9FLAO|nr:histidine kinase [Winogradskyella maritima]